MIRSMDAVKALILPHGEMSSTSNAVMGKSPLSNLGRPHKGRVIRDGDIDPEHSGDRSQHALGLPQRLMEHQAKREASLDGDRRVDRRSAALSGGRRMPCLNGVVAEPHRNASPPYQCGIVFRPVRHPVPGLRDLVAAALVELVRHGASRVGLRGPPPYERSATPGILLVSVLPRIALRANSKEGFPSFAHLCTNAANLSFDDCGSRRVQDYAPFSKREAGVWICRKRQLESGKKVFP